MKDKKSKEVSITQPLLQDLITRQKAETKISLDQMADKSNVGSTPLEPSALYQNSGSGYNADFEFPQE